MTPNQREIRPDALRFVLATCHLSQARKSRMVKDERPGLESPWKSILLLNKIGLCLMRICNATFIHQVCSRMMARAHEGRSIM